MNMKRKLKSWHIIVLFLVFIGIITGLDYRKNSRFEIKPRRPDPKLDLQVDALYWELTKDSLNIDWSRLESTLEYVQQEYDCSDFRLVNLVRILYEFGELIPQSTHKDIREVLTNFRYWWDLEGENSMCYWSENHQILFATAEYLIGQYYPEQVFPVSGLTGTEHMERARQRAMDWLQMRWDHGFIEYYSSVYYKEDIGPLCNLIDFAEDEELVARCEIIMDLLFYDMASQSLGTQFSSVSGRAYQRNRMGREAAGFSGLTEHFWGDGREVEPGMIYGMMHTRYQLPPVLREIALDTSTVVIKQSNGLDLTELKAEGYYGTDNRSMMMQWGMEAFTNPEVVRNSLAHVRACNMFTNDFLGDFTILNYRLLDWLHLEPTVVSLINPQTNGVAIQKGNTYTYRTAHFSMYTTQAHQPGDYADQQHVFGMNVDGAFSIFHTHPAVEKDRDKSSPNYWVGYGHFPHSVQEKNINLSIYSLPKKKGVMESALLDYTRAYFPLDDFDSAFVEGPYAFGKKGEVYCALIAASELSIRDTDRNDLIQQGKQSFWITEAGSAAQGESFGEFVARIRSYDVDFDPESLALSYRGRHGQYELQFGGDFSVDGKVMKTSYPRYDSPYVQGERKDKSFTFRHNGKALFLDFEHLIRSF